MDLGGGRGHLTYSTLVHPGDTWEEMNDSLRTFVPKVKARVSPSAPFGVSLRLSASSVATLRTDASAVGELKRFLDDNDLYVYTVNAFPYGPFKNRIVKEQVFEPDWTSSERVDYTIGVAEILARLASPGVEPSIQTAPLAFARNVTGLDYVARFTRNLLRVAARLQRLERATGTRIKIALEPEPHCYLDTVDDTVKYFGDHVFSGAGARSYAELAGVPISEAIGNLRRYVGVVLDLGHQAVSFEDLPITIAALVDAGVPIFKFQQAAALWAPEVTPEAEAALREFAQTIYLTQTTERREGDLTRYLNLEDALRADRPRPRELRTHFHVPVFLEELGPFRTTRSSLADALAVHRRTPVSDHLEIETYTWDVLPDHLKTGDVTDYVTREIEWVRDQLVGP